MNQQQITHIACEVGQAAGLFMTVLESLPSSSAPTWVPIAIGVCTAVISWVKQEYGNVPQNVPGSTAADIAAGAAAPATIPIAPPPTVPITHPIPTPPHAP